MSRIDKERLVKRFSEYVSYDSESYHERELGKRVFEDLKSLGLKVSTKETDPAYIKEHPESYPNIYAILPGNRPGDPILFSAHLDTVSPGKGKKAILRENGKITSAGNTVLGADDVSGLSSILEALTVIQEQKLPHPDIEVLITTAEEVFCGGAKYFDYSCVRSGQAYVLDLTGPVGRAAVAAPSIVSFSIDVKGKAAHAGFEPEKGINALNIAVAALGKLSTGHVTETTTVNFGKIAGGTGKNIVPETVRIEGEVRSMDHKEALSRAADIFKVFDAEAIKAGGIIETELTEHVKAYRVSEISATVGHFLRAAYKLGLKPELTDTYGGSDGNYFNEIGIESIVLACAMEKVHSNAEYTNTGELVKAAELTLSMMTD